MRRTFWPVLNTILFTIVVPGTVAVYIPYCLTGRFAAPEHGALAWLAAIIIVLGALTYFRCAWEFAVRGLGTPAPIAPTKYLVTTALHRYVRNPMYLGVALVIFAQAMLFRSVHVAEYGALMLLIAHCFVVLYEEPALKRQFEESYAEYKRNIPRWIPKLTWTSGAKARP